MKKKGISSESVSSESNSVLGNDTRPKVTDGNVASFFRSWRYFFWFLGIVLLIGLFYVEENWRGHRAWETYKHEMETRGERFEARAFVPQPVPERENFARSEERRVGKGGRAAEERTG